MFNRLIALLTLAVVTTSPVSAFDIKNSSTPGSNPSLVTPGEIAINRVDRHLIFKNVDGSLGYGSLLNALPSGRKAVEQGDLSDLSVTPNATAAANSTASIFAGATVVPGMQMKSLLFNGPSPLSHIPTGNPLISNGSVVLQTYPNKPATREIGLSIGQDVSTGSAHTGDGLDGNGDKIGLYVGGIARQGSFNTFTVNLLNEIAAGNTSVAGDWIIEADKNNHAADFGDAAGPAGLTTPLSWGIQVVAGGSETDAKRNTASFSVASFTQRGLWNRGYLCQPQSTRLSCFEDHSAAFAAFQDWGTHTYSIDLANASTSGGAIRLKNGAPIVAKNAAGTGDVNLLYNTGATTVVSAETNISLSKPTTVYASLNVAPGTSPNSTGQPSGTFASTIYNNTNAAGQNGLLVKNNFATAAATVLEVGIDVVGGAYALALQVKGDRKLYLWDGSAMTPVSIGAVGSGPGGSGRALYLP